MQLLYPTFSAGFTTFVTFFRFLSFFEYVKIDNRFCYQLGLLQVFNHFIFCQYLCGYFIFVLFKEKIVTKNRTFVGKKEIFKFESQIQEMEIMTNNPIISLCRNLEYNL